MPRAKKTWREDEVIQAIKKFGPYPTVIARALGITYQAFWDRKNDSQRIKDAYREASEEMIDAAEAIVYQAILSGNTKLAMEFLKTKGKGRGYSIRIEQTGADGGPIRQAIGPDLEGKSDAELRSYLNGLAEAARYLPSQSDSTDTGGDGAQEQEQGDVDSPSSISLRVTQPQ